MKDFIIVRFMCPFCNEVELAVNLFNATHNPEDWIELVDNRFGGPETKITAKLYGKENIEEVKEAFIPTGFLEDGEIVFNSIRDRDHFYEYLKTLKKGGE